MADNTPLQELASIIRYSFGLAIVPNSGLPVLMIAPMGRRRGILKKPRSKKRRIQKKWQKETARNRMTSVHSLYIDGQVHTSEELYHEIVKQSQAVPPQVVDESEQPEDPFRKIYDSKQLPSIQYLSAPKGTTWPSKPKSP